MISYCGQILFLVHPCVAKQFLIIQIFSKLIIILSFSTQTTASRLTSLNGQRNELFFKVSSLLFLKEVKYKKNQQLCNQRILKRELWEKGNESGNVHGHFKYVNTPPFCKNLKN